MNVMIVTTSLPGFWDWGWLRVPGWLGWGWGAQRRIDMCLTKHTDSTCIYINSDVRGFHGFHFKSKYEAENIQTFDILWSPKCFFPFLLKLHHGSEIDSDDSLTNPDTVDNHETWNIEKTLFSLQSIFLSCLPIIVSEVDSDSPEGTSHWRSISASVTLLCFAFVAVAFYPRSSHFELAPLGGKTKILLQIHCAKMSSAARGLPGLALKP